MDCFWAELVDGTEMTLLEHEAAKWLTIDQIDSVDWLPADVKVVESIKTIKRSKLFFERGAFLKA